MNTKVKSILYVTFAIFLALSVGTIVAQEEEEEFQSERISRQRIAQTGMKFLSVSLDARAASMADAMTAQEASSAAMFYNPAGMAYMSQQGDITLGQTQWIADVTYNMAGISYNTGIGVFGVFGVMVDYGEFLETIRADNEKGFLDVGTITPTASSFGVSYARALTNRFAVGANVKYAAQDFGKSTIRLDESGNPVEKQFDINTMAVDFGILYKTGFKSLNLAMGLRNFSREITYSQESFELPLTFRIGLSMDMLDITPLDPQMHSFLLSLDTERPRDYYENIRIGGEYIFMGIFSVRAGYAFPHDVKGLNAGFGLTSNLGSVGFRFDYAYSEYDTFGNVNRLVLGFNF